MTHFLHAWTKLAKWVKNLPTDFEVVYW